MPDWLRHILMGVLVGSLLVASQVTPAQAGEPQDKIHQTVDEVLTIVNNKALQPQERRTQIRQAVLKRFGFEEMAQRSMGQHWRTLTPQQRQEFVGLFTDLLERSYINRIENFKAGPQAVRKRVFEAGPLQGARAAHALHASLIVLAVVGAVVGLLVQIRWQALPGDDGLEVLAQEQALPDKG